MAALARENRGAAGGKPDKVALAEVHDALKRHYQARAQGPAPRARARVRPHLRPLVATAGFLRSRTTQPTD